MADERLVENFLSVYVRPQRKEAARGALEMLLANEYSLGFEDSQKEVNIPDEYTVDTLLDISRGDWSDGESEGN